MRKREIVINVSQTRRTFTMMSTDVVSIYKFIWLWQTKIHSKSNKKKSASTTPHAAALVRCRARGHHSLNAIQLRALVNARRHIFGTRHWRVKRAANALITILHRRAPLVVSYFEHFCTFFPFYFIWFLNFLKNTKSASIMLHVRCLVNRARTRPTLHVVVQVLVTAIGRTCGIRHLPRVTRVHLITF